MEVKKENLERSEVKLTISLTPEECQPYVKRSAVKLSQQTTIPGFRPGHVPYETMLQKYGFSGLLKEALDEIITEKFYEAVKSEKLDSIGQPKIDLEKMSEADGVIFTATVALLPEVEYKDFDKVKYKLEEVKVEETDVDKILDELREYQAVETDVKRKPKIGDRVELDYQLHLAGVPVEGGQQNNFSFIVGKNQVLKDFEDNSMELEINGEKEFILEFPSDYFAPHLAGKKVDAKIILRNVIERTFPEVDENFSKKLGHEKVEDLRSAIKSSLEQEKQQAAVVKAEQDMIDQVLKVVKFGEIPTVLINNEVERMVDELRQQLAQQQVKLEDYLFKLGKKEDELKLDFVPKAIQRIQASLLLRKISINEKIQATEEEIHHELDKQIAMARDEEMKKRMASHDYHEYVASHIIHQKTLSWLKEKCK